MLLIVRENHFINYSSNPEIYNTFYIIVWRIGNAFREHRGRFSVTRSFVILRGWFSHYRPLLHVQSSVIIRRFISTVIAPPNQTNSVYRLLTLKGFHRPFQLQQSASSMKIEYSLELLQIQSCHQYPDLRADPMIY